MNHMQVGIPAPVSLEDIKDAETVEGMRRAIHRAARDSALINAVLQARNHGGMSGEDTYVMLAYHALLHLEQMHKTALQLLRSTLPPRFVVAPKEDENGIRTP